VLDFIDYPFLIPTRHFPWLLHAAMSLSALKETLDGDACLSDRGLRRRSFPVRAIQHGQQRLESANAARRACSR
jgi:hypothetical protein